MLDHNEHLFIFISIIYAYLVSKMLLEISEICVANSTLGFTFRQGCEALLQLACWGVIFLFACQTWWSLWGDKRKANKKFKYFILLISLPTLFMIAVELLKQQSDAALLGYEIGVDREGLSLFSDGLHRFLFMMCFILAYIVFMQYLINGRGVQKCNGVLPIPAQLVYRVAPAAVLFVLAMLNSMVNSPGAFEDSINCLVLVVTIASSYMIIRFTEAFKDFGNSVMDENEFIERCLKSANEPHRKSLPVAMIIVDSTIERLVKEWAVIESISRRDWIVQPMYNARNYIFVPHIESKGQVDEIVKRTGECVAKGSRIGASIHKFSFIKDVEAKESDSKKQLKAFLKEAISKYEETCKISRKRTLISHEPLHFPYVESFYSFDN